MLWNLAIHQILYTYKVKLNWILFPASKNIVLSKKSEFWRRSKSAKLGLFTNQPILPQIFCVTSTESLVCWVIMSWVIQVYNIQKSSQLLSIWSISAHIQCVFWTNLINTIIFYQIDFVANFPLYILIDGSSQTFLVISQFFMFFAEMLHISAERHLSKISFSYFYSPWHPQTFGTIKKIGVSPSFTLAVKSTVKTVKNRFKIARKNHLFSSHFMD